MKAFTRREFVQVLRLNGYVFLRHGKGSHDIYTNGINTFPVSYDLNYMIARSLIKKFDLQIG